MTQQEAQDVITVHIEQTLGVRSGKPRIKGTRIAVSDVVLWSEQGMAPDQLVAEFPQLSLADVHAALAYYHDNQAAIDRQIQESRKFAARVKAETTNTPITSTDADGHPISSFSQASDIGASG